MKENTYMDDILDSVKDEEEANRLKKSVTTVLNKGGFRIKEWIMSGERVKKTMSLFGRDDSVDYSERVLGMLWDPVSDTFHFSAKLISLQRIERFTLHQI